MKNKKAKLKCFDTLSNKYVEVEVEEEIEKVLLQSYWKEDMQERRYMKRTLFSFDSDYKDEQAEREELRLVERQKSILEAIIEQEQVLEVKKAISILSKEQQKIVNMIYFQEMSQTEVAEHLNVSKANVCKRLKTIHKALFAYFNEKYFEE